GTGRAHTEHRPPRRPNPRGGRPMSAPTRIREDARTEPDAPQEPRENTGSPVGLTRSRDGALGTLKRGIKLSPEFTKGLWLTLLFASVATVGKVVVPIAVQQIIDNGIAGPSGPDLGFVAR